MYKSPTSLVYTFWEEEIFEFLSKSVHLRNVHGSYRLQTNASRGTYMGRRLDVVCQ